MPTGYTAGILDGTMKTFQQFAKKCIRNFGAAIHMRDESWDKDFVPRVPSQYHLKEIKEAQTLIDKYSKMSDEGIKKIRRDQLLKDKSYHTEQIAKIKSQALKLNSFLAEAKEYVPPTPEHDGIKKFMVEQLQETIKWDGDAKYHEEKLINIENELVNLHPAIIRIELVESAQHDLEYHKKEYDKDVENCNKVNEFAQQYFDSLKKLN